MWLNRSCTGAWLTASRPWVWSVFTAVLFSVELVCALRVCRWFYPTNKSRRVRWRSSRSYSSSFGDINWFWVTNSLTVLLGELCLLFPQFFQVQWRKALNQLENLLTWGQRTENTPKQNNQRDQPHRSPAYARARAQPSPWFRGNRALKEMLCSRHQLSVTGWTFQFTLHLTTRESEKKLTLRDFFCWVNSSPSTCCQHSKRETNPEVVVALKTLQEAFPLRITTDGSIRIWWRQSAPGAKDLEAMGLEGECTHKHSVTTANHGAFNQICNRSGSSLVSCQAHGLCTGGESEKAAWNRSYGLEWTAAAAVVHTGSAWMSPARKQ